MQRLQMCLIHQLFFLFSSQHRRVGNAQPHTFFLISNTQKVRRKLREWLFFFDNHTSEITEKGTKPPISQHRYALRAKTTTETAQLVFLATKYEARWTFRLLLLIIQSLWERRNKSVQLSITSPSRCYFSHKEQKKKTECARGSCCYSEYQFHGVFAVAIVKELRFLEQACKGVSLQHPESFMV